MSYTNEVTAPEFTQHFLQQIKHRREELFQIIPKVNTSEQLINQLLLGKPYAVKYANFIHEQRSYRNAFTKLRNIPGNISQSDFQNTIDELWGQLCKVFERKRDKAYEAKFTVEAFSETFSNNYKEKNKSGLIDFKDNQQIKAEIPKENYSKRVQKDNFRFQFNIKEEVESKPKQSQPKILEQKQKNSSFQSGLLKGIEAQIKLNTSARPVQKKIEQKKDQTQSDSSKKYQVSSPQNIISPKKAEQITKPSQKIQKDQSPSDKNITSQKKLTKGSQLSIQASSIIIQVRYLQAAVDYKNYKYNGYSLKKQLQFMILDYLKQNTIDVRRTTPQLLIMQDISFLKSAQAGNYRFNPFCDCLEIYILRKNHLDFDRDFKVSGDLKQITFEQKSLEPKEWNRDFLKLAPESSIDELADYICQKRQETQQNNKGLKDTLKGPGGAIVVQDLFGWQRSDFTEMEIKPTFAFQILELIEQIKDISNIKNEDPLNDQKKQCIKTANSHKILRYVVYKAKGKDEVKKIAWLNMKNLQKAFNIVRQQIQNQELLEQLKDYFNQFALDPEEPALSFSRGMILYGPPGTGKTQLTESLPNIIGFHLISKGLSAADFMKSLVGQTSRMIKDLVNRATVSPYLMCSIGIDEVDGLVPDRKDKDEKNKGEGISILLSVIGGNKDVPNLTYMTSTNYLKKIDQAIRRRLSGQYQVGRPNPSQRQTIIVKKLDYVKDQEQKLEHMIKITTNFTGAALKNLTNTLIKNLRIKKMKKQNIQLNMNEITNVAVTVAKQFSITLGVYTLPQIYQSQSDKKFLFTEGFLRRISNQFLLVKHMKNENFGINYATEVMKFFKGQLHPVYQTQEDKITVSIDMVDPFDCFFQYIEITFKQKGYKVDCFNHHQYKDYKQYSLAVKKYLSDRQKMKNKKKTVLVVQDFPEYQCALKYDTNLFQRDKTDLYIIYYLNPDQSLSETSMVFFGSSNQVNKNANNSYIRLKGNTNELNYSGRIMVELNEEARMAFELKNCIQHQSKVAFRLFLKSQESNTPKDVIPELVDFFTKQEASYILLIDYELLLQNDAFEEKKILEIMEQKMMQAKNYKKVAVIINLDSLIILNQNASDSNFGRTMSYSIQNHNMYQILLSYMRQFGKTAPDVSRWMTVIAKHPELIKIVKKDLSWPAYPEQIQAEEKQKQMQRPKRCIRCDAWYTELQNEKEKKCMQHPGRIIDTVACLLVNEDPEDLKVSMYTNKKKDDKPDENKYVWTCCLKNINEAGHVPYKHIEFETQEDDVEKQRLEKADKWKDIQSRFQKKKPRDRRQQPK